MTTASNLEQLREFDTSLLANTIGYVDALQASELYLSGAIQSVTPSLGPTVGIAYTCEVDASTPGNVAQSDLFWDQVEAMTDSRLPKVFVIKTVGSRPDHECVLGDGIAKLLYSVGCHGLVTDGRVRDIAGLLTTPFAAYCRGTAAHHAPLRYCAINRPIEVGGITIRPGDVLHANAEGVIRIPDDCLEKLPAAAVRMRAFEHEAHLVLRRTDIPVRDKRRRIDELVAEYGFSACINATEK